jgi:glycosyltransferase involved in cell wall biosynthesis
LFKYDYCGPGAVSTEKMLLPPPLIPKIKDSGVRPYWSVMIPTYNARTNYLEETLRGILQQDPGQEQMQIEVVDDCSSDGAPLELIRQIAGDRIAVHREPKNNGLPGIWNRCLERARGKWVHILHQDDFVLPGFYAALGNGAHDNHVGAAFSRFAMISPEGHWLSISDLHRESAGLLDAWHEKITIEQLIQCPAIVVRRAVYEHLGGFRPQLTYTSDWEMWQRIAAHYSFWFEPSILACYRRHGASATSRLMLQADDVRDVRKTIDIAKAYHPPRVGSVLARKARAHSATWAVGNSRYLLVQGHFEAARKQVIEALRLSRSRRVIWGIVTLAVFCARIAAARLKRRFRSLLSDLDGMSTKRR